MSKYEVNISTDSLRRKEVDKLLVLIARAGYSVYIGFDKSVCFPVEDGDSITKIKVNDE